MFPKGRGRAVILTASDALYSLHKDFFLHVWSVKRIFGSWLSLN